MAKVRRPKVLRVRQHGLNVLFDSCKASLGYSSIARTFIESATGRGITRVPLREVLLENTPLLLLEKRAFGTYDRNQGEVEACQSPV